MKKLILLLLFVPLITFGQTKDELQLCLIAQSTSFTSDSEADNALERILGVIGLPKNFVLTPCSEINNAMATSYKGIRYILYDRDFMRLINSRTNDWSSLAILAHEVAHHVMGHALDLTMYAGGVVEAKSLAAQRKQELEADEWAGFIMARLGASLSQALSFTEIFIEKDDTYDTHPTKSKRVNAVRKGFSKAGANSSVANTNKTPTEYTRKDTNMSVEEYYNRGRKRIDSNDYYGAIADFNQAIRIKPDYDLAYFGRAFSKSELQDYSGAIADYSKSIELNPNDAIAYYNRGYNYAKLKEYYGAIGSYSKAIELKVKISEVNAWGEKFANFPSAYFNRGLAKEDLKNYYGAIVDYTIAIMIKPDFADAYAGRARAIIQLGVLEGACADFRKAISLGSTTNVDWIRKNCN